MDTSNNKRNILILGSGGREHSIAKKLSNSNCNIYYCGTHNNPGLNRYAKMLNIGPLVKDNFDALINETIDKGINSVIVGPENLLMNGIVDIFYKNGIPCIGPYKEQAKIETSKSWSREFMTRIGLFKYCPNFIKFNPDEDIKIDQFFFNVENGLVIKADGLHGGKGVQVFDNLFKDSKNFNECIRYCHEIQKRGESLLIEERLLGEEFSLISFSDGVNLLHTIPVKDYKRAYDNDIGPNTGSMGSITGPNGILWFLDENDMKTCRRINEIIINGLYKETGKKYKGIIYGSFMKTSDGIKIIEFNCRFGDPECINLLELLETDLLDIFDGILNDNLNCLEIKFKNDASVFKYLVPNKYPLKSNKNEPIFIDSIDDNFIFASITWDEELNCYKELGSRTIGYICRDKTISKAAVRVNNKLNSENIVGSLRFRKDIGLNVGNCYANSGVNIDEGNSVINKISSYVHSTYNYNVIGNLGDFSGLFNLKGFIDPVLVSTMDGVGTKSILVLEKYGPEKGFEMLGRDLVNHCINDTLVKGAKPLFFLDYFASSKINSNDVTYFVKGLSEACREAECVLIGGETAEMPDIYYNGQYDLVGTMIGVVEKQNIIDGKKCIKKDDLVISLPSTGPHTNGYSLIRKLIKNRDIPLNIMNNLCATHKSYLNEYKSLINAGVIIKGMCHITGGGLIENPPRVVPSGMSIKWEKLTYSKIFKYLQKIGNIDDQEMLRVFNCGMGMLIFVDPEYINKIDKSKIEYKIVGKIV